MRSSRDLIRSCSLINSMEACGSAVGVVVAVGVGVAGTAGATESVGATGFICVVGVTDTVGVAGLIGSAGIVGATEVAGIYVCIWAGSCGAGTGVAGTTGSPGDVLARIAIGVASVACFLGFPVVCFFSVGFSGVGFPGATTCLRSFFPVLLQSLGV